MRRPVPRAKKASVTRVACSSGRGQDGREEVAVQVDAGGGERGGEGLPVLLGAEEGAGLQQTRLELGVAADAVLDDVDQFGGAPLVLGVLGLVAGLADVGEDRVLVAVAVGHVVKGFGDHVGDGVEPVHRADVAPGGVEGLAQGFRVLNGPVAGLFGGELGVGEPAPADQHLQLDLGGDLGAGDVRVEGADQDVDGLVGGAQIDRAARAGDFFDKLEVVVTTDVAAVGGEGAVDHAEAAVDAADVDQVLQDPAGHALVLGGGAPGGLGGDARDQPGDDLVVVGAGVEVHVEGDEVDRGQGDLGHAVDGILTREVGFAGVEVVDRRGAGERAQPPGQPLVGGRPRCGAGRCAELGRSGVRRCWRCHGAQTRSWV
ncbi:hypothetical protein GCM10020256_65810 [Streptomyces thermocoprophilus]